MLFKTEFNDVRKLLKYLSDEQVEIILDDLHDVQQAHKETNDDGN